MPTYRLNFFSQLSLSVAGFFPILFFILLPKPSGGGYQLALIGYLLILLLLGIASGIAFSKAEINHSIGVITFGLIALFLFICSIIFSGGEDITLGSFIDASKPAIFLLLFLLGVDKARKLRMISQDKVSSIIYVFVLLAALSQLPLMAMNAFSISALDALYPSEKAKPLGEGLRLVGSLLNPNFLGWFYIFLLAITFSLNVRFSLKSIAYFICLIGVAGSGSKSALVLLALIGGGLCIAQIMLKKTLSSLFYGIIAISVLSGLLLYLYINKDVFSYTGKIFLLLEGNGLEDIKSIADRYDIWSAASERFWTGADTIRILFGMGPRNDLSSLDNDYLYSFYRWGLLGSVTFYMMWVCALVATFKARSLLRGAAIVAIIAAALNGYQAETISGWGYGLILSFFLGFASNLSARG